MVPDPKWHLKLSIAKSLLRFGAAFYLITGMVMMAGVLFLVAEILGVLEELV